MKKQAIIIVTILLIIIIGIVTMLYLQNRKEADRQNQQSEKSATSPQKNDSSNETSDSSAQSAPVVLGSYKNYTEEEFTVAKGTRVLFFHAPWCPQCRMIDKDIQTASIPDGITIFKTDYDSHQSLRQKYGVTLQTTFVAVDEKNELLKKYVAYNEPNFTAVKDNLLSDLPQ